MRYRCGDSTMTTPTVPHWFDRNWPDAEEPALVASSVMELAAIASLQTQPATGQDHIQKTTVCRKDTCTVEYTSPSGKR